MPTVRIKLGSLNINELNEVCETIRDVAKRSGVAISGPIPLPTKRMKVTTRKSPCGDGTATFDRFEMRVHKRIIEMPSNESVLHSIMKLSIPRSVNIKIEMKD
jgi:small subunit ribosomal protein S10